MKRLPLREYLVRCGKESFHERPLGIVDQLVLSMLSYVYFENYAEGPITLYDFYHDIVLSSGAKIPFREKADEELLRLASLTRRFSDVIVLDSSGETKKGHQFGAVLFDTGRYAVVAFRGTDNSLHGWREDMDMCWKSTVPSMEEGSSFLMRELSKTQKQVIITGHSKGGTIAIYSYLSLSERNKERIVHVYDNDGPGCLDVSWLKNIDREKITCLIPESSFIGVLQTHLEPDIVVKSYKKGMFQHDAYSWELDGATFRPAKRTRSSLRYERVMADWLDSYPLEERKLFCDQVFDTLDSSGADDFAVFPHKAFWHLSHMVRRFKEASSDKRRLFWRILQRLFAIIRIHLMGSHA